MRLSFFIFLFDDELIKKVVKAILKAQKEGNSELPILNKQLSEIKFQINNLLKAIQQGLLNESTKKRFEELEEERKELELAIAKEKLKKPILTEEKLLCWFDLFKYGDFKSIDFRRKLVNVFVNSIILYDDKIELHFNFKENAEILKLKKGSDGRSNTLP